MSFFMNGPTFLGLVTGVLQLSAAVYALRLVRLFGEARVGWSLFCAFLVLALTQVVQAITPVNLGAPPGIPIEAMYALVSLLLFTGMVHLETMLDERLQIENRERQLRAELESGVKKETVYLTRVIEELKVEMEMLKRTDTQVQPPKTEPPAARDPVKAAEACTGVLQEIDQMLKSVKTTAGIVSSPVKQTTLANVVNVGNLIREHAGDLGSFMARDPRGKKLPQYIAKLAKHLAREQAALSQELDSLRKQLERIMAMQEGQGRVAWQDQPVEAAGSAGT